MGATFLADADYVLRQILTLKRLGISIPDDVASINQVVKLAGRFCNSTAMASYRYHSKRHE
jgi:hypothetical protein